MRDFLHMLVQAVDRLLDAVDTDTMAAFQADENTRDHSKEYYIALQDLRKIIREWHAFNHRR